jgi:nucleoside phosphorylase
MCVILSCWGLQDDLQPGDVFIPTTVKGYLENSATQGKKNWEFIPSGKEHPTTSRLLNNFQMFKYTQATFYRRWSNDCATRFNSLIEDAAVQKLVIRSEIRLCVGDDKKLASGPAVGKGQAFANWIKRVDRKIVAMEMESIGVYEAALIPIPPHRVIAIRGISDFADERKELIENIAGNKFRSVSLKNAFELLVRGIEAGLFEEENVQNSQSCSTIPPTIPHDSEKLDISLTNLTLDGICLLENLSYGSGIARIRTSNGSISVETLDGESYQNVVTTDSIQKTEYWKFVINELVELNLLVQCGTSDEMYTITATGCNLVYAAPNFK